MKVLYIGVCVDMAPIIMMLLINPELLDTIRLRTRLSNTILYTRLQIIHKNLRSVKLS